MSLTRHPPRLTERPWRGSHCLALATPGLLVLFSCAHPAATAPAQALTAEQRIARSDEDAGVLIEAIAQVDPEEAGDLGDADALGRATALGDEADAHAVQVYDRAIAELRRREATESDPEVQADLEILVQAAQRRAEAHAPDRADSRYVGVAQLLYSGMESALADPVTPESRQAALTRLRRYAGLEPGTRPLAAQAVATLREAMAREGWKGPARAQVERDLEDSATFLDDLSQMLKDAGIEDAKPETDALAASLRDWDAFMRAEVLPRARDDFQRSPEEYTQLLHEYGIDADPRELAAAAHASFHETQAELERRAPEVAAQIGAPAADYRTVLRTLRAQSVAPDALLPLYEQRVHQLDEIARREDLLTIPDVPLAIRQATASEGAVMPAPFFRPPPLMGGGDGGGEFVLPATQVGGRTMDDFSSPAASWWLAAHEGHPGHALQYAVLKSRPFSLARRYFAFNSANVEGWGLYAEWLVTPYLPPDGQMAALQARLMRAAHAFLDIELNLGLIGTDEARRVLTEDVAVSDAWADVCIRRYTWLMPGQAPSYFYGATSLMEIRGEVQQAMGARFSLREFDDYVLSQGLMPPTVLRHSVLEALAPD